MENKYNTEEYWIIIHKKMIYLMHKPINSRRKQSFQSSSKWEEFVHCFRNDLQNCLKSTIFIKNEILYISQAVWRYYRMSTPF